MSLSKNTPTDGKINVIKYKLAKFSLEGEFLGFEDLTTQLQLCAQTLEDGVEYWRFGVTIVNECNFDLTTLIGGNLPDSANKFYEMFIEDADGSLVDVPVWVRTLIDESGDTPNIGEDIALYKLVRRFFIFDTLSGIKGTGEYLNPTLNTTALRWISTAWIVIELDNNNREQIYVPYLDIDYHTMMTTTLEKR